MSLSLDALHKLLSHLSQLLKMTLPNKRATNQPVKSKYTHSVTLSSDKCDFFFFKKKKNIYLWIIISHI